MQSCGASHSGNIYKSKLTLKTQGSSVKESMEIFSEPRVRTFALRLCLTLMSETTTIRSHQHDCLNLTLTRATIDSRQKIGKPQDLVLQRTTGNQGM